VHWVDGMGRSYALAANVSARQDAVTCCNANAYKVNLIGGWPPGYPAQGMMRLAVTAVSKLDRRMPFMTMSNFIADNAAGSGFVVVTGSFSVAMPAAQAIAITKNPQARVAFATAFANTMSLDVAEVVIDAIHLCTPACVKVSFRRLDEEPAQLRSLSATHTVKVDWRVMTSKTTKSFANSAIDTAALKTHIQAAAKAVGTVIVVEAPVLTPAVVITHTTAAPLTTAAPTTAAGTSTTAAGAASTTTVAATTTAKKVVKKTARAAASGLVLPTMVAIIVAATHLVF